jgi:hypothetical protein
MNNLAEITAIVGVVAFILLSREIDRSNARIKSLEEKLHNAVMRARRLDPEHAEELATRERFENGDSWAGQDTLNIMARKRKAGQPTFYDPVD